MAAAQALPLFQEFYSETYPDLKRSSSSGISSRMPRQEKLGRLDSLTASQEASNQIMPRPRANAKLPFPSPTPLAKLDVSRWSSNSTTNLAQEDMTLPSKPGFTEMLDKQCPLGGDESITGDLDSTPERFDNHYFKLR